MSAIGHENNGFAQSTEDNSGTLSPFALRIRDYIAPANNFDRDGLILKSDYPDDLQTSPAPEWPHDYVGIIKGLGTQFTKPKQLTLAEIWAGAPSKGRQANGQVIAPFEPTTEIIEVDTHAEPETPQMLGIETKAEPRRLKLSQKLGVMAAAASLKLSLLEPGKKINAVKEEISLAGRKANLALGKSLNVVSEGLEKVSRHRRPIGLVLGAVALAGVTYTAYKTGMNAFGSSSHVAEKTNHANELVSFPAAPKTLSTEHTQPLQHLSSTVKPQHTETLATVTAVAQHKPKANININDLTWNVARQKAPGREAQLINDALKSYGHGAHLVGSNSQIELSNGKIVNFQQMREINQLIVKARP